MFTGLIAELGSITAIEKGESSAVFTINAPKLPQLSLAPLSRQMS
jgi:riboflavin synthase